MLTRMAHRRDPSKLRYPKEPGSWETWYLGVSSLVAEPAVLEADA